jgi:hypothetical protein
MKFDAKASFANLSEKERLYGHHSAEGQAIRVLSRALDGWSAGNLSARDVIALCDQAIEDWLKARLSVSAWSPTRLSQLLSSALATNILTLEESNRLQLVHDLRMGLTSPTADEVNGALTSAIEIVERRWS